MNSYEEVNIFPNDEWETFVAFIDIAGFKNLMRVKDEYGNDKAYNSLSHFYNKGKELLNEYSEENLKALFISDSAICFIPKNITYDHNINEELNRLLKYIKNLNEVMLEKDYVLTTSISFGHLKYEERIAIPNQMSKEPIYGDAYVKSFLDNEEGKPKIQPGECRIVNENLPEELDEKLGDNNRNIEYDYLHMIEEKNNDDDHYYFYWMRENPEEIEDFKKQYKATQNIKYNRIKELLKGRD